MTRKLYDEDARLLEFTGTVLSCIYEEKKKVYAVVLDQTAFFPEEGGQLPDRGILDGQPVLDVRLMKNKETGEETVIHHLASPILEGSCVTGQVDWQHRFDQMQQHSGEHIISGLVHRDFQYNNVGFHLGAEEVTLDFDGPLTLEQLRKIEAEANQAVKENFPVFVSFPEPEVLATLNYRSKIALKGAVRIVEFPGYDICACCAPHVERTGEIGLIKVTNVQSHRGGVRVNILCGDRAIADYTKKQDSNNAISVRLSAKPDQTPQAVERLQMENLRLKEQICSLQAMLMEEMIRSLPSPSESEHAILTVSALDAIAARNTINRLTGQYSDLSILLIGTDEEGYRFVIGSPQTDCRTVAAELRKLYGAKGGGSKEMIQGTIQITKKEFYKWIQNR